MVHHRVVEHVPHLQLADLDGFVAMVLLVVHGEIDEMLDAHLRAEVDFASGR